MAAPDDWTDEDWLGDVLAWVDDRLEDQGIAVSGDILQPHVYWWATAVRIPTTDGVVWFKATRQVHAFEAALITLLAAVRPEQSAELLASDPDSGWMLTRDAGTRLREHATGRSQLRCWEELLPEYATLQLELAGRVDELLGLGVPDHRVLLLPDQARELAADRAVLCDAPVDSLTDAELDAFRSSGLAELGRLCRELSIRGVPETLQHDDLHDGNLFVRDDRYVFFDWGDACLAHPFHTLVVTLRALAYKQGLSPGAAEILRLRDAYLEAWGTFGSHADLVEAADLARRTGTLQRALARYRFIQQMPADVRREEQDSVPYGVRLFLQDRPWGAFE